MLLLKELSDVNIPLDIDPPLVCFSEGLTNSCLESSLEAGNISEKIKTNLVELYSSSEAVLIDGFYFVSAKSFFESKGMSNTWRNKVLNILTEQNIFLKGNYTRRGKGKKPVIYLIPDEVRVKKTSNKNELAISGSASLDSDSIGVQASDNYLTSRPATVIELSAFLMDALPRSPSEVSHTSEFIFQGNTIETTMSVYTGKKSAYDGDVRTLIALCTFIEDEFLSLMISKQTMNVEIKNTFDIDVTTIVKYLNGKDANGNFKYGAGYNNVAIDSMIRLSSTLIEFDSLKAKFGNEDDGYRNEPRMEPLSNVVPYSSNGKQRIQFQLANIIMSVLKMSAASTYSKTDNINSKQINNMVIRLGGNELGRVFLRLYCLLSQSGEIEFIPWKNLVEWKNKSSTKSAFVNNLKSKIKEMGSISSSGSKSDTVYSVMGLLISFNSMGIRACIESNYEPQQILEISKLK